jgi:hypothetical protein
MVVHIEYRQSGERSCIEHTVVGKVPKRARTFSGKGESTLSNVAGVFIQMRLPENAGPSYAPICATSFFGAISR